MEHENRKALVAILAGGYSPEGAVALWSGKHLEKIFEGDKDYHTYLIHVNKDGWHYEDAKSNGQRFHVDRNDFTLLLPTEGKIKFDLAVLFVGGSPGEDGQLQGYLQITKVPFVGCDLLSSAVTFNKSIASRLVRSFNSPVVHVSPSIDVFYSVPIGDSTVLSTLNTGYLSLPVIVKPANSGSSLGVSKVSDISQLTSALARAFEESNHIIVEQFIHGREITVGVFRISNQIQILPITEIVHSNKSAFYDAQTKLEGNDETQVITPANLSEDTKKRVEAGAIELYEKFHLNGLVRIDLMLQYPDEKVFFLEVNSAPGQTEYSIITQQLAKAGWQGARLVDFYKQLFKEALVIKY
ncbi:unnamed protein product [Adineta ricciae]|uniref:ATP-grasp domain-containing protein n=1 Tax=Adineta ricciae TaxID=249248 RepID=A0A815FE25_ADIRI|nr:unnamed protein product [Adineta ricciae]CAF1357881.1 unnamed protein product [Adineta ricciae]